MLKLNSTLKKKYIIKVPESVKTIYCNEKNLIVFEKLGHKKYVKLDVKILLLSQKNLIVVTDVPVSTNLKNYKKLQGTTVALIKRQLIELSYTLFIKLELIGVGYRVFPYEKILNQVYFKLGYSHLIYFNISDKLSVSSNKFTKLFLSSNASYNTLTQTAAQIRSCKVPEVYKGKGILYDQEKIILKKGKKV